MTYHSKKIDGLFAKAAVIYVTAVHVSIDFNHRTLLVGLPFGRGMPLKATHSQSRYGDLMQTKRGGYCSDLRRRTRFAKIVSYLERRFPPFRKSKDPLKHEQLGRRA